MSNKKENLAYVAIVNQYGQYAILDSADTLPCIRVDGRKEIKEKLSVMLSKRLDHKVDEKYLHCRCKVTLPSVNLWVYVVSHKNVYLGNVNKVTWTSAGRMNYGDVALSVIEAIPLIDICR